MSLNRVFSASLFPFISSNIDHNLFLFFQLNQQKRVYYHNNYYFLDKLPALPILALTFPTFILKLPMLSIIATVFPKSEDRYVFLQNQQMLFIYKALKVSPNLIILVSKYSFLIKSLAIGFFKSILLFLL